MNAVKKNKIEIEKRKKSNEIQKSTTKRNATTIKSTMSSQSLHYIDKQQIQQKK
jgi:hypothetical protein